MSFLNTDYSENQTPDFQPLPEADYEAIIKDVKRDATKTGTEFLQLNLAIRNDLDKVPGMEDTNGKYHNRVIPIRLWQRKATGEFAQIDLQRVCEAAGVPEHTEINSADDLINILINKPVKVHVLVNENEYKGEVTKRNEVPSWNFSKTAFPNVQHKFKQKDEPQNNNGWNQSLGKAEQASGNQPQDNPFGSSNDQIDINDDDLPF